MDRLQDNYNKEFRHKPKKETKLEKEKRERKELREDLEKIAEQGQVSEKKGIKAVKEEVRQEGKRQQNVYSSEMEWLKGKMRFRDEEYLSALGSILWRKMKEIDWTLGTKWKVTLEGRKLLAEFTDRYGRRFTRGIKTTGEAKYDYKAVTVLADSAQETLDQTEKPGGELKKTKGGILLP